MLVIILIEIKIKEEKEEYKCLEARFPSLCLAPPATSSRALSRSGRARTGRSVRDARLKNLMGENQFV